jgi:hypothetical protein
VLSDASFLKAAGERSRLPEGQPGHSSTSLAVTHLEPWQILADLPHLLPPLQAWAEMAKM